MKNSERKTFYSKFLPMLLVFMLPFIVIICAVFLLPAYYQDTFLGELSEKYTRLKTINESKITVIGGSSVAFGLDSGLMEEKTGRKVVNFGLYANLGTKLMMDLAKENINPGDIIVLAPELNKDTYSLFFNAETTAQAFDGIAKMLLRTDHDDRASLIGALWTTAGNKIDYALTGDRPENSGAYKKENFNEYGDNIYDRPYNIMNGFGNPVTLDFANTPEYDEYIDYVNDFTAYAKKRGAEVYFSFPPINNAAIEPFVTQDEILEFYENLYSDLDCKIISDIFNYIMDEGYFYDSEFHLNNSGVTVRTVKLIDDIKRELKDDSLTLVSLPSPSGRRPDCDDFDLVKLENSRGWTISNVCEAALKKDKLSVPDEISGIPVVSINTGAFEGSMAEMVTLGKNIRIIEPLAFDGAKDLTAVIVPDSIDPASLNLPAGLDSGCADGFKLYVPPERIKEYESAENLSHIKDLIAPDESFVYKITGNSAAIVSLTETGKARGELTVPDETEGVKITGISAFALSDASALKKITLGKNINRLEDNAFAGTPNGLEARLPEGIRPSGFSMPTDPSDLGGNPKLYAYSGDYEAMSNGYPEYTEELICDNLWFTLSESDGSYTVTGLNERGMSMTSLTIPEAVDGIPVRTVAAEAFDGSSLTSLDLGTGITRLDGRALAGSAITELIIPDGRRPEDISVPNSMSQSLAIEDAHPDLKIYVDPTLYESYISDYFWGDYGGWLTPRE